MAVKILMLGGRRCGKTSILATVLHALGQKSDSISIQDNTNYSEEKGLSVPLADKRREVDNYLQNSKKIGNNTIFTVDMTPNNGEGSYQLTMRINGAGATEFEFIDVPGEWMAKNSTNHQRLNDIAKECDIFIIAIDTPYMMQEENENIHDVYNRVSEIADVISGIPTENSLDRKLILFVPVKGEKWLNSPNGGKLIMNKVGRTYAKAIINKYVENPKFEFWCLPVQTVGGIEHARLMPPYRVFMNENDEIGETCSIDEYTGIIHLTNGRTLSGGETNKVEEDRSPSFYTSFTWLPISWYKSNGKGFAPQHCEQVTYHIIRFLVEKEKDIIRSNNENRNRYPWWIRIFLDAFRPFGNSLNAYDNALSEFRGKILHDQGFGRFTNKIETEG